jgi:hypothetical protein
VCRRRRALFPDEEVWGVELEQEESCHRPPWHTGTSARWSMVCAWKR